MVDTRYCHQLRVKLPFLKIHLLQDHPWSIGSPQKRSYFFNLLFNWCVLFKAWLLLFLKLDFWNLSVWMAMVPRMVPEIVHYGPRNPLSFFDSCSIFLSIFPIWVPFSLRSMQYIHSNICSKLISLPAFSIRKSCLLICQLMHPSLQLYCALVNLDVQHFVLAQQYTNQVFSICIRTTIFAGNNFKRFQSLHRIGPN